MHPQRVVENGLHNGQSTGQYGDGNDVFFQVFRGYGTGGKGDDMDDDQQRLDHVDGVSGAFCHHVEKIENKGHQDLRNAEFPLMFQKVLEDHRCGIEGARDDHCGGDADADCRDLIHHQHRQKGNEQCIAPAGNFFNEKFPAEPGCSCMYQCRRPLCWCIPDIWSVPPGTVCFALPPRDFPPRWNRVGHPWSPRSRHR